MSKEELLQSIKIIVEKLELDKLDTIQMSDIERKGYEDDLRALRDRYREWDNPIYGGDHVEAYD